MAINDNNDNNDNSANATAIANNNNDNIHTNSKKNRGPLVLLADVHAAVAGQVPADAREVLQLLPPAPEGPAAADADRAAALLEVLRAADGLLAELLHVGLVEARHGALQRLLVGAAEDLLGVHPEAERAAAHAVAQLPDVVGHAQHPVLAVGRAARAVLYGQDLLAQPAGVLRAALLVQSYLYIIRPHLFFACFVVSRITII